MMNLEKLHRPNFNQSFVSKDSDAEEMGNLRIKLNLNICKEYMINCFRKVHFIEILKKLK